MKKKKFYSIFEEKNDIKIPELNNKPTESEPETPELNNDKPEESDFDNISTSYNNIVKFNKKFRNLTEDISRNKIKINSDKIKVNPIEYFKNLFGSNTPKTSGYVPTSSLSDIPYNRDTAHQAQYDYSNTTPMSADRPGPYGSKTYTDNMPNPHNKEYTDTTPVPQDAHGVQNVGVPGAGHTAQYVHNPSSDTSSVTNNNGNVYPSNANDPDGGGSSINGTVVTNTSGNDGVLKTLGDTIKTHWKNASGTVSNWIKENPNATLGLGAGAAALGAYALWQRYKRKKAEEASKGRYPSPVNASNEYYPYDYYSITERNYYDAMGNYLYQDDKPEDLTYGERLDNKLNHFKFEKDKLTKDLLDKSGKVKDKVLDFGKILSDKSSKAKDKGLDIYKETRKNLADFGILKKDKYDTLGKQVDRIVSKATGASAGIKETVSGGAKKSAGWGLGKLAGAAERVSSWADRKRGSLNASVELVLSEYDKLMNSKVITESYDYHPAVFEKFNEDICNLKMNMDRILTEAFDDPDLPYEVKDEMNKHLGLNFDDKFSGCDFGPEIREKWNSYVAEPKCASNFDRLDVIRDKCCLLNDHKLAMRICAVATAATLYFMWKKFSEHHLGMRPCEDNKMLSNVLFITGGLPNKLECCKESEDIMNNEKLMCDINSLVENEYSVMSLVMNDFSVPTIIKNTISEELDITKYITVGTKNISENTNNVSMKKKIIF